MNGITVYGCNSGGGQNVGLVMPDGTRALVYSGDESENERALRLANRIIANELALEEMRTERDLARSQRDEARQQAASVTFALRSAISGKRRFFGPVICRRVGDNWNGAVWLLDMEKRERGLGLHFGSLAALREAHPELWPIGVSGGDIVLDAIPIPAGEAAP